MSVLDYAREYGIGISQFVSVGNKPDVSGNDLLAAVGARSRGGRDPHVRRRASAIPRASSRSRGASRKTKPIIVVKSGRSRVGRARGVVAHRRARGERCGGGRAAGAGRRAARRTIEELFDMAMAFGVRRCRRSRRTAVLTNAGGPGILAADAHGSVRLELVELESDDGRTAAAAASRGGVASAIRST